MHITTGKRILRLAIPLILQQLCLQLQVWIDRAMLGHVNAEFFSAVGNTTVPYHMVTSVIIAICSGTAILVAQNIGAGNLSKVAEISESSFWGNSLLSGLAFLFFLFFSDALFRIMGVQAQILDYSLSYIRILSLSLLILGPSATATSILQGLGFTKIIMISGIVGNLSNILLDWVLIFGKLGFPALGIEGAAIATVIANFLSAPLTILFVLRSKKMPVKLHLFRSLSQKSCSYRSVLALGIPSGLEYGLWNIGNLILVSFLNRLDMLSAGIYTLVFSIETVPLMIYMGFANAGLTLVGQEIGAKDLSRAKLSGFLCLTFSIVVCIIVGIVFRLFPRQILNLFTDDRTILDISVPYLIFIVWILFPKAVNNVIGLCIRGMGDTRWMLYTQVFGTFFMITAGYFLILRTNLGLSGIFYTLLADETIRGTANLIRFSFADRQK